jgi:hypothetical protein
MVKNHKLAKSITDASLNEKSYRTDALLKASFFFTGRWGDQDIKKCHSRNGCAERGSVFLK